MNEREALDRIAVLCDKADAAQFASAPIGTLATFHLREVLAEVSPEPGGVRDALMDLLIRYDVEHPATLGEAADVRVIYVNRILALVRPVAGVTLTPEEAAALTRVLAALRRSGGISIADLPSAAEMDRLAARLEAAS